MPGQADQSNESAIYKHQVIIPYFYLYPTTILLLTPSHILNVRQSKVNVMEDNVPIDDKKLLRLFVPSAPEPPAKRQCPVVPQHSANGQQIKVQFTGGKICEGGQTAGVVAGLVEFGSSGMNIPVMVKQYTKDCYSVAAYRKELAALSELKNARSVVKLLGTCAEGLVLERLPLELRDLYETSDERQGSSEIQVHYLLKRPTKTEKRAKEFISMVYNFIYTMCSCCRSLSLS